MIPKNEQGVVSLFSKWAEELGYKFVSIGTACPDAIVEKDGKLIRLEFEFKSSNFRVHKHDPSKVDLIVCWEDDWVKSPLPVLSLSHYSELRVLLPRYRTFVSLVKRLLYSWFTIEGRFARKSKLNIIRHTKYCVICGYSLHIIETCTYELTEDSRYLIAYDCECSMCHTMTHWEYQDSL